MILPDFDVLIPTTVAEACEMLADQTNREVRLLAGGTDLLVDLRRPIIPRQIPHCDGCSTHPEGGVSSTIDCTIWESDSPRAPGEALRPGQVDSPNHPPAFLISLHKLEELKGIHRLSDGGLEIGALTTITEIERSSEIRENWTALAEGADNLGSPLVRNRGTIGGNIVNARPAADLVVPTIGLGGILTLQGPNGEREIPAAEFPRGPGKTTIGSDEILTTITYPPPETLAGSAYYKLANRKALEISTVGVAAYLALEKPGGPVSDVRVALGAVGPTPLVANSVGDVLIGKKLDDQTLTQAARAAADDARPIDDHRGSAWYRQQMVEVLTRRMLFLAGRRAGVKL